MKIAILGTENSHANAFARLIRDNADFKDMRIIGAYGYDSAANDRLRADGLVTRFADSPDAFLGEADGILVTARHGDHHRDYALPYVKAGVSAFIDKPFTVNEAYADELIQAAKASGACLCGGSSLKFLNGLDGLRQFASEGVLLGGHVSAPVNMVNDYAGFYFYAQHLIEMMFAVFGSDVKSVCAHCPDETKNRVSAIFDYGTYDVLANYDASYEYAVTVETDKGSRRLATTDLNGCYERELSEFLQMMKTGRAPYAPEALKKPVTILHAIETSYREHRQVMVR